MDSTRCPAQYLNDLFNAQYSVGTFLAQTIVDNFKEMTSPKATTSTFSGITHGGNWPVDAEFGVEYRCHDRQFPQVDHGINVEYFDDASALEMWLAAKREWVAGTDFDFSMNYRVYEWNWGPEFKYERSI